MKKYFFTAAAVLAALAVLCASGGFTAKGFGSEVLGAALYISSAVFFAALVVFALITFLKRRK